MSDVIAAVRSAESAADARALLESSRFGLSATQARCCGGVLVLLVPVPMPLLPMVVAVVPHAARPPSSQADAILAMQLRRLTGLERAALSKEADELRAEVREPPHVRSCHSRRLLSPRLYAERRCPSFKRCSPSARACSG